MLPPKSCLWKTRYRGMNMVLPGDPSMPCPPTPVCPGGRAGGISSLCPLTRGRVPTPLDQRVSGEATNFSAPLLPTPTQMAVSMVSPVSHEARSVSRCTDGASKREDPWAVAAQARHQAKVDGPLPTLEKGKPISTPFSQGKSKLGCPVCGTKEKPLLEGTALCW